MQAVVKDTHGHQAVFMTEDLRKDRVRVALPDGTSALIAANLFNEANGAYSVPVAFEQLEAAEIDAERDAVVLPLHAERLNVGKEWQTTGKVRVTRTVHEEEHTIDEPLLREQVDVRRVAVNEMVDKPADLRREGETLIIPVYEEVLVVEKRLMLKEELHVTKRRTEHAADQSVTLRREEAHIDRSDT